MGLVAQQIHIPIATGERLHTLWEFEMLLARGAVQYVRPDVCICGGISGGGRDGALPWGPFGGGGGHAAGGAAEG